MTRPPKTRADGNPSRPEPTADPAGQVGPLEPPTLATLRGRVGQLLDEFLAQPDGPARQILELSMVTYLASGQSRREERALGEAAESRRKAEAVRREAEGLRAERLSLVEQNRRLAAEFTQARRALDHELRIIEDASKTREITQAEMVRRISAAIGLGPGMLQRIEPGCEEA